MKRQEFMAALGGVAASRLAARGQQALGLSIPAGILAIADEVVV
jgi:hypothetical protein